MAKYRKIDSIIEADQWFPGKTVRGVQGADANKLCGCVLGKSRGSTVPHVHTIHNNQIIELEPGDWIIPEPSGHHFYPVKPDIFQATYELVG